MLRDWRDEDLAPWIALNADPRVREFFPSILTASESAAQMQEARGHIARHGFGPWAVEVRGGAPFVGFIGLSVPTFDAHFTPCVEVGYRLAFDAWGHGYATEGARAVLRYGFQSLRLSEIVSFTTESNWRSRRVMDRLGMHRDPADDFDHPNLHENHPLRRHVLYRLRAEEQKRNAARKRSRCAISKRVAELLPSFDMLCFRCVVRARRGESTAADHAERERKRDDFRVVRIAFDFT
jgi:ribosomal-protein-alanine N-acetyltransferase